MPHRALLAADRRLVEALAPLTFAPPVAYVYNPLVYAWPMVEQYTKRYGAAPKRVVFMGMNPGPWGMSQTGVPFGEVGIVRDWLRLAAPIGKPPAEHPARPILGLACTRSEVSGSRLWGLFRERFGTPEAFFAEHYVLNYCPLVFLEASGKNRTPDQLPAREKAAIAEACDRHLAEAAAVLQPEWLVGIGKYAESRARVALAGTGIRLATIPHPSPASPAANRGWAEAAVAALVTQGVWT